MSEIGYAVVRDGKIDLKTVYVTERGAMLIWICLNTEITPMYTWTDNTITIVFKGLAKEVNAKICQVKIDLLEG